MKKLSFVVVFLILGIVTAVSLFRPGKDGKSIVVYQSPTCSCCKKWVKHLKDHGFNVKSELVSDVTDVKLKLGLPMKLASCHTAMVDGYIVEGHVPAKAIEKLLKEKPSIKGISVPGMPMGSPGMEGPHKESFDVVSFLDSGEESIFMSHNDF